jgi:hypothetical protein
MAEKPEPTSEASIIALIVVALVLLALFGFLIYRRANGNQAIPGIDRRPEIYKPNR